MRNKIIILLLVIVGVSAIYFACIYFTPQIVEYFGRVDKEKEYDSYGLFGDSTGAINTLFSALAFAMVIFTLYLQSESNSKQEKENNIVHFEQNFFSMTQMLEQIVANLSCISVASDPFKPVQTAGEVQEEQGEQNEESASSLDLLLSNGGDDSSSSQANNLKDKGHSLEIKGRQVFAYYYNYLPIEGINATGLREGIRQSGIECYKATTSDGILDHYFRYLYRIIKYVDECQLLPTNKQKHDYICVLRAQLSCYELLMLFYNCQIPDQGRHKFKDYIERYQLFNNLRTDLLARPGEKRLYTNKMKPDYIEPAVVSPIEYKQSAFVVVPHVKQSLLDKLIKALSGLKRLNILHRLDVIEAKLSEIASRPRRSARQ